MLIMIKNGEDGCWFEGCTCVGNGYAEYFGSRFYLLNFFLIVGASGGIGLETARLFLGLSLSAEICAVV